MLLTLSLSHANQNGFGEFDHHHDRNTWNESEVMHLSHTIRPYLQISFGCCTISFLKTCSWNFQLSTLTKLKEFLSYIITHALIFNRGINLSMYVNLLENWDLLFQRFMHNALMVNTLTSFAVKSLKVVSLCLENCQT